MKIKTLLCILLFFCKISFGQKLNLQDVINSAYAKRDRAFLDNRVLCFLIPANINFIDTSTLKVNTLSLVFFNEPSFKKYIKKSESAFALQVIYDSLEVGELQMKLEISKVDAENYFITPRIFTYIDRKMVLLKYDSVKNAWVYNKLLKQWEDF
ncbi:hypothetical protein [Mucilaginibacter gotjawali]|uniref:Uncharacterized protein n=2 Tax=Mucilaginibacter gotjawali TaxID=1550579 RepID=A0A839SEA2_9SPHI|nr:hypothetical protein [Mucilaginibacter gotjawali]MBB3055220.1 hypothetical protein [Mucilaginibacter gotjawali]BAU56161.1 hypothetical protein MgSA37_04358 [Mucilaginibacter gotjawali]